MSQLAEDKWARKLVRVSKITWKFNNHEDDDDSLLYKEDGLEFI